MSGAGRRRGERGAESLELVACAGLLSIVVGGAAEGVTLARLDATATEDARVLARAHAACDDTSRMTLADVDPAADRAGATVRVDDLDPGHLRFRLDVAMPAGPVLGRFGIVPAATVVMAYEPGCRPR